MTEGGGGDVTGGVQVSGMTTRNSDKPRPVCSGCGRKAGTIVDTMVNEFVLKKLCYGCISTHRINGLVVEVTTPRPAVRA